jgi:hypothetical protein
MHIFSATTSSSNSEAESIPTKRSRTSPLSIEEQFQKQFSQSFEAHFLKAKVIILKRDYSGNCFYLCCQRNLFTQFILVKISTQLFH